MDALELSFRAWEDQQKSKQQDAALQQLLQQRAQESEHAQTIYGAGHVDEKQAAEQQAAQQKVNQVRNLVNNGGNSPYMELNGTVYDDGSQQTPGVDPSMVKYAQLLGIDPRLATIQSQQDIQQTRATSASNRDQVKAVQRQKDQEYQRFRKFATDNNLPPEEIQSVTQKMLGDYQSATQPSPFTYYDYLDEQHDPAKKTAKTREITDGILNGDFSRMHELVEPDPKTGKVDIKDLQQMYNLKHGSEKVQTERLKATQSLIGLAGQTAASPTAENISTFNAMKALHEQKYGAFTGPQPKYTKPGQFDLNQELHSVLDNPAVSNSQQRAPVTNQPGNATRQFSIKSTDAQNVIQQVMADAKSQARAQNRSIPVMDENGKILGYANP